MGKVIHWELCQKFQFDHTNKWYMHNPASVLENDTHKLLWDFDIQMDHLISTRPCNNQQKKGTYKIVDFAVLADHRIKLKESEMKDKYLDLYSKLKKKLWNMKVTFIPIVIDALGTVTKGLIKGQEDLKIRGRVEIIQITEYWEEYWRLEETCCHSNSSEKPSTNADMKNSQEVIIIRKTKLIPRQDQTIQTKQCIPKNSKRRFYLQIGEEWTKTYHQLDAREAKKFWSKILELRDHNKKAK